jgi:hypothetical protein
MWISIAAAARERTTARWNRELAARDLALLAMDY